jgi:hypothetical protein
MSYVPPHLRAGAQDTAPPSSSGSSRGGYSRGGGYGTSGTNRDYGNFGGYRRENGRENGHDSGARRPMTDSRSLAPPEVVWAKWKPSDRVNRLQQEQVRFLITFFVFFLLLMALLVQLLLYIYK